MICFIGSSMIINADSSGVIMSPMFKLDTWSKGNVYNLATEYSYAAPENAGIYFTRLGTLEAGYSNNSNRPFPMYLTDDDGGWAYDDDLKRYEGYFAGRSLEYIKLEQLVDTSGNIDGTSDRIAELFLQGWLGKLEGDTELANGTDLFYYEIIMN